MAQAYIELVQNIENNNLEIKANNQLTEAENYLLRTGLNPDDPQVEYGYYPGTTPKIGTKKTLDITQSFEFPTSYKYRKKAAVNRSEMNDYTNHNYRQQVLLEFSLNYVEIIYLNKIGKEIETRMQRAREYLNAFELRLEKGDAIVLDVNKAKLQVIDLKNQLRLNRSQQNKHLEVLKQMNNNVAVIISDTVYPFLRLDDYETILMEFMEMHPILKRSVAESTFATNQTRLNKATWWPDLLVGYGSETILDESFRGVKLGVSVPLWQDKNTIKYAKAYEEFTHYQQKSIENRMVSELYQKYIEASALKANLNDYETGLNDLNSIELLDKSLQLGQITFVQYLVEISYFYTIWDDWLLLEKEYYQMLARLYAYKL